jgi:hypothetical protein
LRKVEFAPRLLYAGNTDLDAQFPESWLAITDDPDGAQFLVVDTARGSYLEVDPIDPTGAEIVAENVEGMLDWVGQFLRG